MVDSSATWSAESSGPATRMWRKHDEKSPAYDDTSSMYRPHGATTVLPRDEDRHFRVTTPFRLGADKDGYMTDFEKKRDQRHGTHLVGFPERCPNRRK